MSNNPTSTTLTRTRIQIAFCLFLRVRADEETLICTRINTHPGHCCDEITGQAWNDRGRLVGCINGHDHSAEKGL